MFWFLASCALVKLSAVERSHPRLEGQARAPALPGAATIARDSFGVPHVRGETEADAWYGLGYAHGQDRLFQADLNRRVAFGELSPWFGEGAAEYDLFVRGVDLRGLAERAVERLDPDTRALVDAYVAGINDAAAAAKVLPIEHRLLKVDFEPWTAADCLGVVWLLSWNLADNLEYELAALELRDLPAETLDRLLRTSPLDPPIEASWDEVRALPLGERTPEFDAFLTLLGKAPAAAQASNNWVVGPERSADGKPILANDPHLGQSVPSLWYAADLAGGELHVAGATLPGLPGFPIGHDERAAWGLTNVMADLVDLAVLKRDGERGVWLEGRRVELEPRAVTVAFDGGSRTRTVFSTPIGPVVSAVDAPYVLVMRWDALELQDETLPMLRRLAHAGSVQEVLDGADRPLVVALNLVVADVDGDYAWQTVGSMVDRRTHTGRVPYLASEEGSGWAGWLSGTPGERRPERGFVATANQRPDHPLAGEIGTTYVPPHRYDRIVELLGDRTGLTPADQAAMQLDRQEGDARRYRDALLDGVSPADPQGARCRDLLAGWDLVADPDSSGAAVWALFERDLVQLALADDVGEGATRVVMSLSTPGRSLLDADGLGPFLQDREATVGEALTRTCRELTLALGEDPAFWTLGALHPLALEHRFAARSPALLKSWNMPSVPWGGSGATVNAAAYSWTSGEELPVGGMASLRVVMPLADLGASTLVHPGGQSGQPKSPLYRSHFVHFANGQTLPLWFDDEDVAANTRWSLELSRDPEVSRGR